MALNDLIVPNAKLLTLLKAAKGKPRPCALATGRGPKGAGPLVLVLDKGGPAAAGEALKKASIKAGIAMGAPWLGHATFQAVTLGRSTVHFSLAMLPPENVQEQFARLLKPVKVSFGQVGRKKETEESVSLRFGLAAIGRIERSVSRYLRPVDPEFLSRLERLSKVADSASDVPWDTALADPKVVAGRIAEAARQMVEAVLEELDRRKRENVRDQADLSEVLVYLRRFRDKDWGAEIPKVIRSLEQDPNLPEIRKRLTLAEALRMKSAGIDFSDVEFDTFQDGNLDVNHPPREIGRGGFNAPVLLSYVGSGGKPLERVFKAENDTFFIDSIDENKFLYGFDSEHPRTGNRNIMTSRVAKRLGTNVLPRVRYGLHGGKLGLMMEKAEGLTPHTLETQLRESGKTLGLSSDQRAKLLKQLNELEWCDVLSEQLDRNPCNYLVDFSGGDVKVTGIDNDISFTARPNRRLLPPLLIDQAIHRRILALDFEKDLAPGARGRLTAKEIETLGECVQLAKNAATSLASNGFLVTDWADWRTKSGEKEMDASEYLRQHKQRNLFKLHFSAILA